MSEHIEETMICNFAKNNSVLIFGAVYCKYCRLAKSFMEEKKESFTYINLDEYEHMRLEEKLKKINNVKTIPIIYKKHEDGEYYYIGGFKELQKYYK